MFSPAVTWVGQGTKILILVAFVIVASYLAGHTRFLFHRLVRTEVALRSEKEAIERELELASTVQAALLPRQHVPDHDLQLHGTIMPGRYVGGDYYDFIRLSGGTVLMVVADVAGKGVPAALIMSAVRASVHLFASMQLSLEELIERLNALLYESTTPDGYVTLFAAEIDAAGNLISYINAGHPPPILYSNGRVRLLGSGTMPLGLFPVLAGLQAEREEYSPGSVLVACTDGIWERSNAAGELFGEHGLRQFVLENDAQDCAVFARGLLERVRVFGGNLPMEDDATLAVARFTVRT
jgi:sigma-B regulation protein RsbU (phosphoserine phosphatase)